MMLFGVEITEEELVKCLKSSRHTRRKYGNKFEENICSIEHFMSLNLREWFERLLKIAKREQFKRDFKELL